MKNIIVKPLVLVFIVMGLFSACPDAGNEIARATECTVTFNPAGGSFLGGASDLSVTVSRDAPLGVKYPTPIKAGYDFAGWFDGFTRYTATDPINTSLVLTAKWAPEGTGANYFTVSFSTPGDAVGVASIQVVQGEPMGYKYPLTWRTGYYFTGWFNGGAEYTPTTVITGNITLTAQWDAKTLLHVTFDAEEGNYFPEGMESEGLYSEGGRKFTIDVYEEDGIFDRLPSVMPKNGLSPAEDPDYYFLVYWKDDENRPYVETTFIPITANITLLPKWGAPDYSVPLKAGEEYSPTLNVAGGSNCNPSFRVTEVDGQSVYTIWNANENNSTGRWQMLYWITLNLPEEFNIRYYNKYSVSAKFYGNIKATSAWRWENFPQDDTLFPREFYITNAGEQLDPNRFGYGQISFCISTTGTGEAANGQTIFQQYNLGMGQEGDGGTVNSTWKPIDPGNPTRDPIRPQVLLIQTSDDWIGRIEVTEIRFHNDPDDVKIKD